MTEQPWFRIMSASIGVLVGIIQITVFMLYAGLVKVDKTIEYDVGLLQRFESELRASRYTTVEAGAQNRMLLNEIHRVEGSLKDCINRVILDGGKARC